MCGGAFNLRKAADADAAVAAQGEATERVERVDCEEALRVDLERFFGKRRTEDQHNAG